MNPMSDKKPLDYVKIIFRRKWFLIIPVVIGLIAGLIAGNVLPKLYRASTLILVEEGRIINPLVEGLAVSTSTAQRLSILREQILGWDRINQLITTLNLAKDVRNQQQFEDLVRGLRRRILVNLRGRSLVSISYDGKDPMQAQNIVKTITDIFISENLRQQTQETENAITFINDQLALYQKKLKQSEIAAMEDQLNKLLVDSTEKHPLVQELRRKITSSQNELDRGKYDISATAVAGSETDLTTLRKELTDLKQELSTTNPNVAEGGENRTKLSQTTNEKLYKLLLLERIDNVSARDANVNQKLYNTLLERLETAKITQSLEASKEGTKYTILDPARLPLKPVKPNKLVVLFMGIFLGGCAGIGLIFSLEVLDNSLLGVDEAKAILDMPILGAISKIVTQYDLKVQKLRQTRITAASIAGGVILLVVIIINFMIG